MNSRRATVFFVVLLMIASACSSSSGEEADASLEVELAVPEMNEEPQAPSIPEPGPKSRPVVRGVNVFWPEDESQLIEISQNSSLLVNEALWLGANSMMITFPIFAESNDQSHILFSPATPSPEELRVLVLEAKKAGLHVALRPMVVVLPPDGSLVELGQIDPVDEAEWFWSYGGFMLDMAEYASAWGVDEIVIGTNFQLLEDSLHWTDMEQAVRMLFRGAISYSNDWIPGPALQFDLTGVNALSPIALGDDATVEELVTAWGTWLDLMSEHVDPEVMVLHEVGIRPLSGEYANPMRSESTEYNADVQANWIESACIAAQEAEIHGLYVWAMDFNDPDGRIYGDVPSAMFMGQAKPMNAVQKCFEQLGGRELYTA